MGGIDYNYAKALMDTYGESLNNIYQAIIKLLCDNTYLSTVLANDSFAPILDGIKGVALVLCTLFFLIDFFSKSLHLQWVTWENVLMLFLKLTVAKVCVENAEWITTTIYEGFCSLGSTITADQLTQDFLPTGSELYSYFLTTSEVAKLDDLVSFLSLNPLMISMKITVIGWLLMITLIISNIVVIGRVFELAIYTLIAPIPLATLACDGLQDVGKNFLKSYVAVSILAVVLRLMFMTYNAVSSSTQFQQMLSLVQDWRAIIMCLVLGLSVMQSGQWAKRIVGSM